MTHYREILRLDNLGFNHTRIAESIGKSRTTVIEVLRRAQQTALSYAMAQTLSDREIYHKLYPNSDTRGSMFAKPDYEYIHAELARKGLTLQLLWSEYAAKCHQNGELPYQETQFRKYYHDWLNATGTTMRIARKPGEQMEVDWAGATANIIDNITGLPIPAYLFVAVLPYSSYAYVEAFVDMRESAWLAGHVDAYSFFGGVARMLVPDNLKTGVTKHTKEELLLNKAYQDLAEHYGTAIVPTRVRKPRDKATVEGAVGIVTTYILATVRNDKFFTIAELNAAIQTRLYDYNNKPFQKKDGSRATMFADERQFLLPLPNTPFELAEWRTATASKSYHVLVDENHYSVPFEYAGHKVDIRLTRNVVEVFYESNRIASHIRINDKRGGYSTLDEHMPPNHRAYINWNADKLRDAATQIGVNTLAVAEAIISSARVEQQAYKPCRSLLSLAKKYSPQQLESACAKALSYTSTPTYKAVLSIIKIPAAKEVQPPDNSSTAHAFIRGAEYYANGGQQ